MRTFYSSFPIKLVHDSSRSKAWLTQGIKISCINKWKLYLISRNSQDQNKKIHYRKYCKVLTDVIKLAKQKYYNNLLTDSTNKTKTTWNIINENINKRHRRHDISSININGVFTQNNQVIADTFNSYFLSVAQHITANSKNSNSVGNHHNPLNYLHSTLTQPFPPNKLKFVSPKEIANVVRSLKTKESHGYDEIPTKVIKQSISYISSPLTYICNMMLSSGVFPTRLKFAQVKPLYKKGERMDLTNYRPISLLPSFSKIFEKIIFKRLIQHLDCNEILAKEQFGFRSKSSTDLAAFNLINDILMALNNKLLVGGIFCDLQKAFYCVDHEILLAKMHQCGITGKGHKLIKSYLENRSQRVIITSTSKQYYSESEPIKQDVPQGSILGPLLFIIYINDILQTIALSANPLLFADDTSMFVKSPDPMDFIDTI